MVAKSVGAAPGRANYGVDENKEEEEEEAESRGERSVTTLNE